MVSPLCGSRTFVIGVFYHNIAATRLLCNLNWYVSALQGQLNRIYFKYPWQGWTRGIKPCQGYLKIRPISAGQRPAVEDVMKNLSLKGRTCYTVVSPLCGSRTFVICVFYHNIAATRLLWNSYRITSYNVCYTKLLRRFHPKTYLPPQFVPE